METLDVLPLSLCVHIITSTSSFHGSFVFVRCFLWGFINKRPMPSNSNYVAYPMFSVKFGVLFTVLTFFINRVSKIYCAYLRNNLEQGNTLKLYIYYGL